MCAYQRASAVLPSVSRVLSAQAFYLAARGGGGVGGTPSESSLSLPILMAPVQYEVKLLEETGRQPNRSQETQWRGYGEGGEGRGRFALSRGDDFLMLSAAVLPIHQTLPLTHSLLFFCLVS